LSSGISFELFTFKLEIFGSLQIYFIALLSEEVTAAFQADQDFAPKLLEIVFGLERTVNKFENAYHELDELNKLQIQ